MSDHTRRARTVAVAAAIAAGILACSGQPEKLREGSQGGIPLPKDSTLARIALGDVAGSARNTLLTLIRNPYEGNTGAMEAGGQLFIRMNCVGCHGYDAKGGMGPNLTDTYWRYGGSPAEIYKSISEGRPQGMPAWGAMLTSDEIWKLTAYVQSLGGSFPAQLALQGKQGNLGDMKDTATGIMKGRQSEP
ncbi:MAG: c-type cytochrome [Gemmatimonadota bacterium]|nr:c-type cytochrome [Gemmatimonadota bacterium]